MFKQGDYVRLIHAKEEGRIIRAFSDKEWEIETPDGFRIPVLSSELVRVDAPDKDLDEEENKTALPSHTTGIQLAAISFNDQCWDLYLINDSAATLLFSLYETTNNQSPQGITHGTIAPFAHHTLHRINWSQLQHEFKGELQLCSFEKTPVSIPEVIQFPFKLRGIQVLRSSQTIPLLDKKGYLFPIVHSNKNKEDKQSKPELFLREEQIQIQASQAEVDLHIEKLISTAHQLSPSEILQLQLETFEKQLDLALANGQQEITFIHGLGNGTLKAALHKRLGQNKHVAHFSDAHKQKFGYGATLVVLK